MLITRDNDGNIPLIIDRKKRIFDYHEITTRDFLKLSNSLELVNLEICKSLKSNEEKILDSPRRGLTYNKGCIFRNNRPLLILCRNKKAFISVYSSGPDTQVKKLIVQLKKDNYNINMITFSEMNNRFFNPLNIKMEDMEEEQQNMVIGEIIKEL